MMLYSLGRHLYWWFISPQLSVVTWFVHLVVTSTSGLLVRGNDQVNKPCQYRQLGINRPPVEVSTK
jgi:hypothetical protein